ncbi:hypothetical protein KY338_04145 [Candidatus Woesearchaeota archaeon]|nr:hypothetical protein [Candidatus Woesearchaeota archaeon]MBW3005505.1 hypothetical protein [Candidatus Woesearchaeota archaeon]
MPEDSHPEFSDEEYLDFIDFVSKTIKKDAQSILDSKMQLTPTGKKTPPVGVYYSNKAIKKETDKNMADISDNAFGALKICNLNTNIAKNFEDIRHSAILLKARESTHAESLQNIMVLCDSIQEDIARIKNNIKNSDPKSNTKKELEELRKT